MQRLGVDAEALYDLSNEMLVPHDDQEHLNVQVISCCQSKSMCARDNCNQSFEGC